MINVGWIVTREREKRLDINPVKLVARKYTKEKEEERKEESEMKIKVE